MDEWIQKQIDKYSNSGFGESDKVVDRKIKSWEIIFDYAKPDMTFLDLGCNSGRCCLEMKNLGLSELGIDLQPIIDKIQYDINTKAMNLEKEFPEGKFDLIYCRETIEHIRNYEDLIQNIIGALSENGTAILCVPCTKTDGPKHCQEHVRVFEGQSFNDLVDKYATIEKSFNCKRSRVLVCKAK